ncbi:MAG: glycine--tRNA ligase subunit beta [Buchnera aphidicola (Schlechtendalia peitan)]
MNKTFLIEIGTEELPPKALKKIAKSFQTNMIESLKKNHIQYKKILWFATPRRIAIKIEKLNTTTQIIKKKYKGPSTVNAFDYLGNPTQSTKYWMKKLGITINQTFKKQEKEKEWLFYEKVIDNQTIEKQLIDISIFSFKHIYVPTFMKWNTTNIQFSRPIRNIVMLLDNEVIHTKILGIYTNRLLRGHIFMKSNIKINILHANEYPKILLKFGKVIADYNVRKNKILQESKNIANSVGGYVKIRDPLLEEITSLTEWPTALLGNFTQNFLKLPDEILIYIIENQQKYFTIYDQKSNKITNNFIIISNIKSQDPTNIILDNIKVLHSRFSDAEFFFKKDQKIPLKKYQPLLKKVIFQDSLGSLFDKTNRIKKLVAWITQFTHANLNDCIKSAHLCKCDLVTNMVFEFPKLQGIVGMYYALYNGESQDIAIAIKEHYFPRFSKDNIPINPISYSLALADKIDTLIGLFAIGKNSTSGDKDPFSLRRLTIGIIQIILKKNIPIDLSELIMQSLNIFNNIKNKREIFKNIKTFFLEKIYFMYIQQKYTPNIIKSILSCQNTQLIDIDLRIKSMFNIYNQNTLQSLVKIYKRVSNILILSKEPLYTKINFELIQEKEEHIIFELLKIIEEKIKHLLFQKDYTSILFELYNFYEPICNFFKNIKIHNDNYSIKINRLTMLNNIKHLFHRVADFSRLY